MGSWMDYFIGSSQSRYAFFAIFSVLVAICMAIIFTNTDISIANRMIVVVFVLFVSIFPVGISLFELTCMVNGGKTKSGFNPCSTYAWIITVVIVIYCFFLILATVMSMFTYKKAVSKIEQSKQSNIISNKDANIIAKNMIIHDEEHEAQVVETMASQAAATTTAMPPVHEAPDAIPAAPKAPIAMPSAPMPPKAPTSMPAAPKAPTAMPSASQGMFETQQFSQGKIEAHDDGFSGFSPVGNDVGIETFEQQAQQLIKRDKKQQIESNEIVGYGTDENYMQYTMEKFTNPKASKKPVKQTKRKSDFSSPKPFTNQVEHFANV